MRLEAPDGKTAEWKNATIPAYQRRTKQADALIAGAYLSGTNTRRVRRALAALFGGAVGKDTVSRVWRKVKGDWDAWNARSLAAEPIIRLILDGTVVRVRLDKKSTSISLLVALGVRQDGQKVLLAVKDMGGARMQDPKGDKYFAFHRQLLGLREPVTQDAALTAARETGFDMERLQRDMTSEEVTATLTENMTLASALHITGTPTYVAGDEVFVGAIGLDALKAQIALLRQRGAKAR